MELKKILRNQPNLSSQSNDQNPAFAQSDSNLLNQIHQEITSYLANFRNKFSISAYFTVLKLI